MPELRGRALIESRYGKLGSGEKSLVLGGTEYDLETVLARMDLRFEDSWPIDLVSVTAKRTVWLPSRTNEPCFTRPPIRSLCPAFSGFCASSLGP